MRTRNPDDIMIRATYWFARLADALEAGDAIMAASAREHLRRLGYDVRLTRRSKAKSA
jgi:hypothetical protein